MRTPPVSTLPHQSVEDGEQSFLMRAIDATFFWGLPASTSRS